MIIADAHVHIHDHFSLSGLFLISLQNFRRHLPAQQAAASSFFLLLTESAGMNRFVELRDSRRQYSDFIVQKTGEKSTLRVETLGGQSLFVVAGRQIVTKEKLEVLALGYGEEYPDGKPLEVTVKELEASDCLRVLPWGAGKWLGNRGRIIDALIKDWPDENLYLGDNSNRPSFWPLPPIFQKARKKRICNLPGSDPLPFPEQEKKAGSFGFKLPGTIDNRLPFASLKQSLTKAPETIVPFGLPETCTTFIKHQVAMQLVKRRR
ncbi:MAG: hypothetical protein CSA32_02080 [Desulfobulbus propionicus]|nr:MAG: hypothetical protein CSA32_02080 [Desulfobulbus propionicus]